LFSLVGLGGRALGMLAGGLTALIWIYAIWVPAESLGVTGVSMLVAAFMALLSLVAAIAAFHGHAIIIVIAFVASFLPVGAILLGADHWLRFIGILNVLLALSSGMIWIGTRDRKHET
jgi:hypothetical protein